MYIKPVNGLVSVQAVTTKTSESGLIIPDSSVSENINKGLVIEISSVKDETCPVNPGDTILFYKKDTHVVKGSDTLLVHSNNILGIIK